jgi:cation transport regulator ChaC
VNTFIFGYGSLLNIHSVHRHAPGVKELRAVYIKGFRRSFSLRDEGYTTYEMDVAGISYCGLNVQPSSEPGARVNGVVFEVDDVGLQAMLEREHEYETPLVSAYDFETDELVGKCIVFTTDVSNAHYEFSNPAQQRYLDIALAGAKSFGEKFYEEFTRTTYIDGRSLIEIPGLIK